MKLIKNILGTIVVLAGVAGSAWLLGSLVAGAAWGGSFG